MNWVDSTKEQGFAVLQGVLEQKGISLLLAELDRAELPRSRAGVRHAMRFPVVVELARRAALLEMAREILGKYAIPFRATLFDKSPAANWLVAWHQDIALPLRERCESAGWGPWSVKEGVKYAHAPASALEKVLALRVHLDDSTSENGPLRILPGTHRRGVLTDEQIHDLSTAVRHVECLVGKGGVVAMRPLIVHASSKARSGKQRRVLHIEYSACECFENGLKLAIA